MTQPLDRFKLALQFTLKWEGGAGHPDDLAGAVNRGISQATYDTYRQWKNLPQQPVNKITEAEVEEAYFELFWKPSKADSMCLPLAIAHFDTAVNFSVRASTEFLQEALGGLVVDGDFGRKTTAALQQANNLETAKRYCQCRIDYRQLRVKATPSQQVFLDGWLKRDSDLLRLITQLSDETAAKERESATEPPKAAMPLPPRSSSISPEDKDKVVEKLEQVINLLEEIVVTLKHSQ